MAEKDFCGRLFFLAAIFPFSNEKACLGVIAKTDFFYRLRASGQRMLSFFARYIKISRMGFRHSSSLRTAMKASVGSWTVPRVRIFFLPSFCFSNSFFFRLMSPP